MIDCPHCGAATRLLIEQGKAAITCPKCGSEDTIKCSVVHQAGTTTGSFVGVGVDMAGGIGGFGGRKTSRTLFATQAAPPPAPGIDFARVFLVCVLILVAIVGFFVGMASFTDQGAQSKWVVILSFIGFICGGAGAVAVSITMTRDNKRAAAEHRAAIFEWQRQWVCQRCGMTFEVLY
jgi:predicted RNA-binding Zn-ribbon protein involved in translation (DUF1610 family)